MLDLALYKVRYNTKHIATIHQNTAHELHKIVPMLVIPQLLPC